MTRKKQIDQCTRRANLRMALMKTFSGSSWGADHNIQKKLYKGRIRPVLDDRISSWGTAAKTNFQRVSKVQNQPSRIMTGALRSTPIHSLETLTGLQSMEERRVYSRNLPSSSDWKTTPCTTGYTLQLKRSSFIHQARILARKDLELMDHIDKPIPTHCTLPAWKRTQFPLIRDSIPGILKKGIQTDAEKKALTMEYIEQTYPQYIWTHAFTDGSAEEVTHNGGGGILLGLKDGRKIQQAIPTGRYSINYKAEAQALKTAATMLVEQREVIQNKVVIFSDALSVM